MSNLEWIKKKYPALEYFSVEEGVGLRQLEVLTGEGEVEARAKTPDGKRVMKKIRQFASYAESKLKNGRKLYKFLAQQQGLLTQIIMNNEKLKGLDALEKRQYEYLTELQLSNNEITDMEPLCSLSAPSLQELDLSSNSISMLYSLNSCKWQHLNTLLLSQNRIVSIDGVKIGDYLNLKVLNLSDNFLTRIRHLRRQVNGNMMNFRKLDLSNNYITDLHLLSQCRFVQLSYLDLRNNNTSCVFSVEKVSMVEKGRQLINSRYEIRVSTEWPWDKLFIYGYRDKSRHKLSVKVQVGRERLKRETVQKGRKLIFD